MFVTSLLISSRDKFRKEESFQKQTDSNNRLIFEKCTTRVLSNCRYCEYCRSMNHTKYNCQLIKPCTKCGVKGHKTTSCKKKLRRCQRQFYKDQEANSISQFYHLRWLKEIQMNYFKEEVVRNQTKRRFFFFS